MKSFRKVCRWLHRELGFFAVGLTLVYGISGLAVNHVHHWNPDHTSHVETWSITAPGLGPTEEIAPLVIEQLNLQETPKESWRAAEHVLQVFMSDGTIDVDLNTGEVRRERHSERPVLFDMNVMHLNKGKGVWTVIGDAYAIVLVILALSGIFLVRGKKGLTGRGGVMMGLGIALPILYAVLSRG
jgi:uncharacterized protein